MTPEFEINQQQHCHIIYLICESLLQPFILHQSLDLHEQLVCLNYKTIETVIKYCHQKACLLVRVIIIIGTPDFK